MSPVKAKFIKPTRRKLTEDQVQQLRALRLLGHTYKQLGNLFGITAPAAYFIASGVNYSESHPAPHEDQRAERRLLASRRNARIRNSKSIANLGAAETPLSIEQPHQTKIPTQPQGEGETP